MIVVDLETSGAYPDQHGILSIGAVEFENPENVFYEECRLEDHHRVEAISIEVVGMSEGQMRDAKKKTIKEALQDFLDWVQTVKEKTFAAHNTPFDWKFLEHFFRHHDLSWPFHFRSVDLHTVAFTHMRAHGVKPPIYNDVSALGLGKVLAYCGIQDPRDTHNALEDARLETECFYRLLYGKGLFKEYAEQEVPEYLKPR